MVELSVFNERHWELLLDFVIETTVRNILLLSSVKKIIYEGSLLACLKQKKMFILYNLYIILKLGSSSIFVQNRDIDRCIFVVAVPVFVCPFIPIHRQVIREIFNITVVAEALFFNLWNKWQLLGTKSEYRVARNPLKLFQERDGPTGDVDEITPVLNSGFNSALTFDLSTLSHDT